MPAKDSVVVCSNLNPSLTCKLAGGKHSVNTARGERRLSSTIKQLILLNRGVPNNTNIMHYISLNIYVIYFAVKTTDTAQQRDPQLQF